MKDLNNFSNSTSVSVKGCIHMNYSIEFLQLVGRGNLYMYSYYCGSSHIRGVLENMIIQFTDFVTRFV
jgi:hypothetical protein